jgi:hypothetical protein
MSQRHASHIRSSHRARPLRCRSISLLRLRRKTRLHPRLHLQLELDDVRWVHFGEVCRQRRVYARVAGAFAAAERPAQADALSCAARACIGACTRFAGIVVALVSAMTVARRSCPKPPTAPTSARTANPARVRYTRLARTITRCTRLLCVPERCAHLQTMCANMLSTQSALAPTLRRHVPAGRCRPGVGAEIYGSIYWGAILHC